MNKNYSFNTDIATEYSVEIAIMLNNLIFWQDTNQANGINHHDGKYWTYNSANAFSELYPFWSKDKIGRILRKMEDEKLILSGNYNKSSYDRTKWYSVIINVHFAILQDGACGTARPIPDINTDINTDKEKNNITKKDPGKSKSTGNKFIKPTVDEINDYCNERNNTIDAEAFFDYYEMKGWKIGTNKISCWKSCVRTWERRNKQKTLDSLPADIKAKLSRLNKDQYKKVITKFSHNLKNLIILPGIFDADGVETVGYGFELEEGQF